MLTFLLSLVRDHLSAAPRLLRPALGTLALTLAAAAHASLPIEHWTTSAGTRVYFVRADALPILDVNVDFDAGSRYDPAYKAGLASMTAALIRAWLTTSTPGVERSSSARSGLSPVELSHPPACTM